MPFPRARRWSLLLTGVIGLTYSIAPLAYVQAMAPGTSASWGMRDFVILLISLLMAVSGAFFAGVKKDFSRRIDSLELDVKSTLRLLLDNYQTKQDVAERLSHLEDMLDNKLESIRDRIDLLLNPPSPRP